MTGAFRQLWRRNRWLVVAFALALAVAGFFAIRTAMHAVYWSDPAHRDREIAGWMTPRYVATSWQVPPEVVADALNLDPEDRGRGMPPTLREIAEAQGVPLEDLATEIEAAILAYRTPAGGGIADD